MTDTKTAPPRSEEQQWGPALDLDRAYERCDDPRYMTQYVPGDAERFALEVRSYMVTRSTGMPMNVVDWGPEHKAAIRGLSDVSSSTNRTYHLDAAVAGKEIALLDSVSGSGATTDVRCLQMIEVFSAPKAAPPDWSVRVAPVAFDIWAKRSMLERTERDGGRVLFRRADSVIHRPLEGSVECYRKGATCPK